MHLHVSRPTYPLLTCFVITGDIGALAGAPIQTLVLGECEKLTGTSSSCFCLNRKCCPKATHLRTFQKYSFFIPTHPHLSGNIKDLPKTITYLVLRLCEKLEGETTK